MNTNPISLSEVADNLEKLRSVIKRIPDSKEQASASMGVNMCCDGIQQDCCEPEVDYSDLAVIYQYVDSMLSYLRSNVQDIQSLLWAHINNGHLPVIQGAEGMAKALKALGMDGDYQVQKQTVYANNGAPQEVLIKIALSDKKSNVTA